METDHTENKDNTGLQVTQDLGKYQQSEFVEKADANKLQFFKCPNCGHMHFRHAGYILPIVPFVANQESKVQMNQAQVMLCIKCKHSYIFMDDKLQDVTEHIDLEAWDKTEKQAHKQTGPGGQC